MNGGIDRRQFIRNLGIGLLSLSLAGCGIKTSGNSGETSGNSNGT